MDYLVSLLLTSLLVLVGVYVYPMNILMPVKNYDLDNVRIKMLMTTTILLGKSYKKRIHWEQ